MENSKKNIKRIINEIQFPFIKLNIDNKLAFERGFEKKKK